MKKGVSAGGGGSGGAIMCHGHPDRESEEVIGPDSVLKGNAKLLLRPTMSSGSSTAQIVVP